MNVKWEVPEIGSIPCKSVAKTDTIYDYLEECKVEGNEDSQDIEDEGKESFVGDPAADAVDAKDEEEAVD